MKNAPIKILHIINSFGIGGMENGLINIINHLDPEEFKHEICCIRKSGSAKHRLKRKVKIYEVNQPDGVSLSQYVNMIRVIRKSDPDIVHTRNWGAIDGIISARLVGVKNIVHGEHGWNIHDPLGQSLKRGIVRKIFFLWAKKVIAVSKDISRWLERGCRINPEKIETIINGVDTDKFVPYDDIDVEFKKQFCDPENFIIGTVGRLDPIKNFDLLIQSVSQLNPVEKKLKLLIVGSGNELDRLRETARAYGIPDSVIFTGERNDLYRIYRLMDVFVLPSKNEGVSNTILEAMASGLPVIASNAGGNPELINHELSGLLVEPGSVPSLTNALKVYMNQPSFKIAMGKNARKEAVENFSLGQMLLKYKNTYRSLVK